MGNYTVYHLHDELSLLDSSTHFQDYVDKAVEYGMKSIGFSNHGNIYKWIEKLMYCNERGIKYLHGVEIYLTKSFDEKVRDNFHTVLVAKNKEGFKELNTLIDLSTQKDHMYYKNRLSFDEFLNISDNIIKISACLASPLNKLDITDEYYDKLAKHYDYYEIQYHNCKDQIKYNQWLYELSKKNNIPLIAGTDTHSIDKYRAECRTIKQLAKGIEFSNEDEFDLTFKSYEELIDMFNIQNSLPMDVILEAIENTNVMADSCEEIVLDTSHKYPILSNDDEKTLMDRVNKMYKYKVDNNIIDGNNPKYIENIQEEFRVLKKLNMISFMLFMSEMIEWCEENGIPVCPCRGSVGGSTLSYIINITDVNPIKWGTVFSRFANEDRMEIGDIDCDFSPSQRELVYKYIIDRFGIDNTAYILAIGTVADKGCIDDIGRALDRRYKSKGSESPYTLDKVKKIKKEYEENPEGTRKKYSELFYYFDGIVGTVVSQSVHPAGIVASPVTLFDNYGTFWKDGNRILQIDMEDVHECGLVKYDILGLKNIEIIKDCCEYANIPYPKSHMVNFEDDKVWEDMIKYPYGIFQFESKYSNELLAKFNPHKINDLNLVNASLRPSGESYRNDLLARIPNKNPSELIDNLLKENNGYLVFQEDTIAFLQDICGLSGSDADNIRRAIGRKQKDRLDKAMPQILEGYCGKSDKPRDIAEKEAKTFLQIIEDSSNYQFGKNHSTGYSIIGYYCAMLRYYFPIEFTTAYLNNANNEEDIVNGEELARLLNINIKNPQFRYSRNKYFMNKETNTIYKGINSIKFLNEKVSNELYELRNNQYNTFLDLLIDLENTSINSRQLNILILLGFFAEFGSRKYLLDIVEIYNKYYNKKTFKKDNLPMSIELFRQFAGKETEKQLSQIDNQALCNYLISILDKEDEVGLSEILSAELEYTGSINYTNTNVDKSLCFSCNVDTKYTPVISFYNIYSGRSQKIKISKKLFKKQPIQQGQLVSLYNTFQKNKTKKNEEGKWEGIPDSFDWWCDNYMVENIE